MCLYNLEWSSPGGEAIRALPAAGGQFNDRIAFINAILNY